MNMKTILGASIGNCIHVAGLYHFLKLAESEGYRSTLFGSAVSVKTLVDTIREEKPTILAISYRLTPEVASELFTELKNYLDEYGISDQRIIFGGTPPVAAIASNTGIFEKVFTGGESEEDIKIYLSGDFNKNRDEFYAHDLIGRIKQKYPYPLIRHHFGRPSLEETLSGVKIISRVKVLDVISIGPDQNAQEHFFHPEEMNHMMDGAGGVPLRKPEDLKAIYSESRCGNFPLVRCYAGTRDLLRWAEMNVETIHNAWAAIPLCWYSELDNRSKRTLKDAITENQLVMKWHAARGIPVEVNESHQWSLRDAHDSLAVTMAFLAAYNAKKMGVRSYISQFMLNTPPGTTPEMDIAKMLAKKEMIEKLEDENFTMYREVRAGLSHFSPNPNIAKGQLAASASVGLALKPHIYHVVSYSEGDHATSPDELIESCEIIHGVMQNNLHGMPDITNTKNIIGRKDELIFESRILLSELWAFGKEISDDPWMDPAVISLAIKNGILDTPHFQSNPNLCGQIKTRCIKGAWYAVDGFTGEPLDELSRTKHLLKRISEPVI